MGAVEAAQEIGFGVRMGLYGCRDEDDNDRVLTHAGMPHAVDNLGSLLRTRTQSEPRRAAAHAGLDDTPRNWPLRS
jgi:hypothetical protein